MVKSKDISKKELRGWQQLLIADIFVLSGGLSGGFLGSSLAIIGYTFVILAIISGITRLIKKEHSKDPIVTSIMTILGIILLITFMSLNTYVFLR